LLLKEHDERGSLLLLIPVLTVATLQRRDPNARTLPESPCSPHLWNARFLKSTAFPATDATMKYYSLRDTIPMITRLLFIWVREKRIEITDEHGGVRIIAQGATPVQKR
jgi:hypothetical protein